MTLWNDPNVDPLEDMRQVLEHWKDDWGMKFMLSSIKEPLVFTTLHDLYFFVASDSDLHCIRLTHGKIPTVYAAVNRYMVVQGYWEE